MYKDFVPYELAVKLKELGFNEPCLVSWNFFTNEVNFNGQPSKFSSEDVIQLPSFSQAFGFIREKYGIHSSPKKYDETKWWVEWATWTSPVFETFEEAELACLIRLIEIVENENHTKEYEKNS